jgi:hypothetical protein|nr:MAG TPA: hypothetical protein [Caudoviricetes sp.]
MDWDDLYDDSWELYKKIGNTILPVYVGADAGFTTDTKYLDLMVRGTVVRLAHRCYIFCIKEGALRGSGCWVDGFGETFTPLEFLAEIDDAAEVGHCPWLIHNGSHNK